MEIGEYAAECQEALKKLIDKKVLDIKFKQYDNNCWRLYINTDKGKMIMSFCEDWKCPVVEYRDPQME
jgi:hypothetical protein